MIRAVVAAGGLVALALLAGGPSASAGSLAGSGMGPAGQGRAGIEGAQVEDVRWIRQCWRVPRGWGWDTRCRSAWVPGHHYHGGYGYGGDRGGYRDYGGYAPRRDYGGYAPRGGYDGDGDGRYFGPRYPD
ncbi:hypothetical protein V5F59_06625 [Xanthobacter autotrophicus DSM 431]|uniref:hypothetical protein n=1 Tax=Xanthobacter nonsaccharivorans TaxID=3119912 RepID=UPI00372B3DFB